MPRVVFDPRLIATGVAFAETVARQLLIVGWAKLVAVAARSDASLAEERGRTLHGAPGVWISAEELAWIEAALPAGLPNDLGLVTSQPLMVRSAAETAAFFDDYPALRPKANGIRVDALAVDYVPVPRSVEETQDQLLYCGLEAADMIVSDHHPIVIASGGMPHRVEDPRTDRHVVVLGSGAMAGALGRPLRFVPDQILRDICMLLRPRPNGA